jgi:lipopolysaccharide export system permease protein
MSLLARYLMRTIIGHTFLVMLVLLVLSALYLFIMQLDNDIGVGTYTTSDALWFVALNLPKYAFDMLPIASLIAALLALGNLARSMELIVIRTSGISTLRIGLWVASAGVVLMLLTGILGEFVAPPLEQYGRQMKAFEKFRDYSRAGNKGAWAKDGGTIVSFKQQTAGSTFGGVYIFKFDGQRRLESMGRASSASIQGDQQWLLSNYRETKIGEDRVVPSFSAKAKLDTTLSAEFLGLATMDPDAMTGRELWSYIAHLRGNNLESRDYETGFWARIARTVAVAIIVVLAVPFAFGPMRSTGTGARTVVGILIGVAFFFLAKMVESGGEVFNVPPIAIAWTPTLLLALVTTAALARVR